MIQGICYVSYQIPSFDHFTGSQSETKRFPTNTEIENNKILWQNIE